MERVKEILALVNLYFVRELLICMLIMNFPTCELCCGTTAYIFTSRDRYCRHSVIIIFLIFM